MQRLAAQGQPAAIASDGSEDSIRSFAYFFSRFPSMSNSRLSPPISAPAFPLNVSPSIFSLYSIMNLLSMNCRSAEKLKLPSFILTSLICASFWSGQLIVPASRSPSALIVSVDIRFWPPISYSHLHFPIGLSLSPPAPAKPQSPMTNAAERIAFIHRLREMACGRPSDADRLQPLTAILGTRRIIVAFG